MKWIVGLVLSTVLAAVTAQTCLTLAKRCGKPLRRGITTLEKNALLRAHNELRSKVALGKETRGSQPSASNMKTLVWDNEMASLAQRWADQCLFEHNFCGGSPRFQVGQNLFALIASGEGVKSNITIGVQSWYDEVGMFSRTSIKPFSYTEETGHYSQLLWADTNFVGCGYIEYQDSTTKNFWYYLVCDYGPAGNVIGAYMYEPGTPCSKCPARRCGLAYNGLC